MPLVILLFLVTNISSPYNSIEREVDFDACNYTESYRQLNIKGFEDHEEKLKECKTIRVNDQKLRGAERQLMNDVENILKLSVIVEHQMMNTDELESKLAQTINIVLAHNPSYFTEYYHKPLIELVNSNRCDAEESTILLRVLYKDLFGQPYIDNETRFHTQAQRNMVMTKRIKEAIDPKLELEDLCSTVDSFLAKKILFHEGKIIGKWRRLRANEDLIITLREKDNGDLYIIQTNFDSAFPSIRKIIETKHNNFRYATPYSSKMWKIAANGSLEFKYTKDDIKTFTYPIYHEN